MTASHQQPELDLMGSIEGAMAHNLQDYVTTLGRAAPLAGTACIEIAGGVAAFTGPGLPLTTVKGTGPHLSARQLRAIESFFQDHRAAATIETAPWLDEEAKQLLHEHGYRHSGQEDVVVTTSGPSPRSGPHRVEPLPAPEWPDLMHRTSELPDDEPARELAIAAAHLPDAQLYAIREHDHWIACAQSVPYDDVVIFGCDGTLPEARRRGAHAALIHERLKALAPGTTVTAEVEPGSGSERNYRRAGFRIAYTRTTYVRALR